MRTIELNEVGKKPFDLEEAKNGAAVITRDNRPARIICFDVKERDGYTILAILTDCEGYETSETFTETGNYFKNQEESENDLFLVGKTKNFLYMILCKDGSNFRVDTEDAKTQEEAINIVRMLEESEKADDNYVETLKITW